MRTSAQFAQVLRKGRRGSTSALVVHAVPRSPNPMIDIAGRERAGAATAAGAPAATSQTAASPADPLRSTDGEQPIVAAPVLVGFVVGKSVGNSVVRHRVTRQLRAAASARLNELDQYCGVVIRALPSAAGRRTAELGGDLDAALRRVREPARRRSTGGSRGSDGSRRSEGSGGADQVNIASTAAT